MAEQRKARINELREQKNAITQRISLLKSEINLQNQREILEKTIGIVPKWHPSIHMPKEAARIWLKVTDVRAERLQDMTVEDCKAEGIYDDYNTLSKEYHDLLMQKAYPKTFKKLWDSTISKPDLAKYGWDANPWVWVIEFERINYEREV